MDREEKLIAKILANGEKEASKIVNDAKFLHDQKLQKRIKAEEDKMNFLVAKAAGQNVEKIESAKKTAASLSGKKMLAAKNKQLDLIFEKVVQKLCEINKKEYLGFVDFTLQTYAENGDEVVLSKSCPLSVKDVEKIKVFAEKKLKISSKAGDFLGGVVLSNKVCNKVITFQQIAAEEKEKQKSELSKIL